MLYFNAKRFVHLCECLALFQQAADDDAKANPGSRITDRVQKTIGDILDKLEKDCTHLAFDFALKEIERARADLPNCTHDQLSAHAGELLRRVKDHMDGPLFMVIPPHRESYYRGPTALWDKVTDRFPEVIEDIAEAGKCFAAGRNTATVFHLMRVLEFGVQRFASHLALPDDLHQQPWGVILKAIDDKLKNAKPRAPEDKEETEQLSQIASHLHHVKNAWRNPTMHPKQTYTEEEAESIIAPVRDLMTRLARLL
jgi:hypothetical protein